MSAKFALIIANTEYSDPGLAQLTTPGRDAKDFGRVLDSPETCAFNDVVVLVNESSSKVGEAIDYFLSNRKPDDLLVLYFSGHGVRDEYGSLYLAVKNTNRARLRSTAVKSDFIREAMDQSRSRRQVLILDCCNSGAFTQGTKAATGVSLGTASAFEAGYGRIILTASDSTQYAWEGDKVIGETDNSLFTHFLVEGLEGRADSNGDGQITVDELYEYAYEKVKIATPKQTPSKFSSKQQGEIILRESIRIEDIRTVPLPSELINAIENPLPFVREGAVRQLAGMLNSKNIGLARSAREALERIAAEDDSRTVSRAASQALETIRQTESATQKAAEERKTREKEEAERLAIQKAEAQRLVNERAKEAERKARQLEIQKYEQQRLAHEKAGEEPPKLEPNAAALLSSQQVLLTLGWAISGAISGNIYYSSEAILPDAVLSGTMAGIYFSLVGVFAGAIGGAIGGLVTALALHYENLRSNLNRLFWMALAWAIGGAVGWAIGEVSYEVRGMAVGHGIGAMISMAIIFSVGLFSFDWKSLAWIVLGWAIGGEIGWFIAKRLFIEQGIESGFGWGISIGIGWAIGGFVMGWQLLNNKGRIKQ